MAPAAWMTTKNCCSLRVLRLKTTFVLLLRLPLACASFFAFVCVLQPSTMKQPRTRNDGRGAASGPIDCRHWSETGVVEEWNTLMLNHLCSIE